VVYRLTAFLINRRFGDPGVYVAFQFENRALMLDAGDVRSLSHAELRMVSDLFVSHAHMDHFADFDQLLRAQLDLDKELRVYGPAGIIEQVEHKLSAYSWNLDVPETAGFRLSVMEITAVSAARRTCFRFHDKFRRGDTEKLSLQGGRILEDHDVIVDCALLDHKLPCLAFAIREQPSLHIVEDRLADLNLPVGRWLYRLKKALQQNLPPDTAIRIDGKYGTRALGELRHAVTTGSPGRKICYVTDCQFNESNAERIVELARGADILFIEAKFAATDAEIARSRYHLTTRQAGELAARAGVRQVEPFHFSERYAGMEKQMLCEVETAFQRSRPGAGKNQKN